jgi:uncharacterized membrane protein YfhO
LYIADSFEEGWKAFVNGQEKPIIKTNLTFRGIQLPQGDQQVVLRYEPQSFTAGMYLTLSGLILTTILILMSIKKQKI